MASGSANVSVLAGAEGAPAAAASQAPPLPAVHGHGRSNASWRRHASREEGREGINHGQGDVRSILSPWRRTARTA